MARSFRQSRFRGRGDLAEDVNPSAYIVNLADCMLVLACGFMVAMIVHWNINLPTIEELEKEDLEAVDPETLPENLQGEGSYYVEAGKVYLDPNTGQLYMMVQEEGGEEGGEAVFDPNNLEGRETGDGLTGASSIADSRAAGAD